MSALPIFVGNNPIQKNVSTVEGSYVDIGGETYYKIGNFDQMRPFFMTIVSDSDHWLFISSNGPLTAGRRKPENALFPYYTDDKIIDSDDLTGSKTILLVNASEKTFLWEPFSDKYAGIYSLERNIYKNVAGNKILLEEINHSLNLSFQYSWMTSDEYGFVKKSVLKNLSDKEVTCEILDGIQNLLPYGTDLSMQTERSTLLDAYKKNELLPDTNLGLYTLSSIPIDKAEPSESLKATTVWSYGIKGKRLLCSLQLDDFRIGKTLTQEVDIRAERGSYFINEKLNFQPKEEKEWYVIAELEQSSAKVVALQKQLSDKSKIFTSLLEDIERGTTNLTGMIASADGLQCSENDAVVYRHFSNVLFNIMRGGIFVNDYTVSKQDFIQFIDDYDCKMRSNQSNFFDALEDSFDYNALLKKAQQTNDNSLIRLCYEYLPLTFSRRHGDPSRPWNHFSIEVKDEGGNPVLNYQGNWRDIFQNWEALAVSYPGYLESMIAKFVNASTVDGYNPYRVTRDGIDWEKVDPHDPWSYIGYWGDHQVIYLLKLLELSQRFCPEQLSSLLTKDLFSYANVPYRIKSYEEVYANPYETVDFDEELDEIIEKREAEIGADGKMVLNKKGQVYQVNLVEKLLLVALAKISNFIPEGGIWLNTQRPEWNDANNALVGNGVSMVTLYYLRRYLNFCCKLFGDQASSSFAISEEVKTFFDDLHQVLSDNQALLNGRISDTDRRKVVDGLGLAGEKHRTQLYKNGFSENTKALEKETFLEFCKLTLRYIDHTIEVNEREDGLFHSYNLMIRNQDGSVSIRYLYEMLEGQVAVLSSGYLNAEKAIKVLKGLRQSSLYRKDQHSYILYPDRQLPRFVKKNNIPTTLVQGNEFLKRLLQYESQQIIETDINGNYHFHGTINNANTLKAALNKLKNNGFGKLSDQEEYQVLSVYEKVFDHASFTGRSGTFFGYEGLGCIYWHMVSKLLLAVQENCQWAIEKGESKDHIDALIDHYYDVRKGIGFNKSPEEYGAFPSDAYSHTPGNAGAQQPGMTGQVKEDILARFGELGLIIENGQIHFRTELLKEEEFLTASRTFNYIDVENNAKSLNLEKGSLAFTICQVPVIYKKASKTSIQVTERGGETTVLNSNSIPANICEKIFERDAQIEQIVVQIKI